MANKITINADGTWTPPGGVEVNPGDEVKFEFAPGVPGGSSAVITFDSPIKITPVPTFTGGGTIKVGS